MGLPDAADQPRRSTDLSMRFVLAASLLLALAPSAFAQTEEERLQKCMAKLDTDAEGAYQDGLSWLASGNRPAARQCTALALIALGQEAEGAARLEELANAPDGGTMEERGVYLVQSGNAWLMAGMPDAAIVTLTNALKLRPADGALFTDRARAYVTLKKWAEAGKDLDEAIRLAAGDAEVYRLRGHVRLKLNQLSAAWEDVSVAMKLAPKDVNVIVLRGDVREAMRVAGLPDPAESSDSGIPHTRIVGN
jgi:tetratricopeptide (TPR) repeat protein